jgi:hypothetical protein
MPGQDAGGPRIPPPAAFGLRMACYTDPASPTQHVERLLLIRLMLIEWCAGTPDAATVSQN